MARLGRGIGWLLATLTVGGFAGAMVATHGPETPEQPKNREQVSLNEGRTATAERTDAFFLDFKNNTVVYAQLLRGKPLEDGKVLATSAMCAAKFADLDKQEKIELNPGPHIRQSAVENLVPTDGTKPMCNIAAISNYLNPPIIGKPAGRDNQDALMVAVSPNESGEKAKGGFALFLQQAQKDGPVTVNAQSTPGSVILLAPQHHNPEVQTIGDMRDKVSEIADALRKKLDTPQYDNAGAEERREIVNSALAHVEIISAGRPTPIQGNTNFPREGAQLNSGPTR